VYGRFGRYGEAPAPGAQPMPKSLRDEVEQEDRVRFSDIDVVSYEQKFTIQLAEDKA